MSDELVALRKRILKIYTNTFEGNCFKMSMGEVALPNASVSSLLAFLAQGIVERVYTDKTYLCQLVELHSKLKTMLAELQTFPGHTETAHYHWCMTSGTLIEHALLMAQSLFREDTK